MIIRRDISLTYCHQVLFTQGVFDPVNDTLAGVLEGSGTENVKVLVFVDDQLDLGDSVETYFQERSGLTLVASPISLPGGEAAKNDWSLVEFVWQAVHDHQLCRHSYIIAIGGGAIQDLVGFAASTAHRGIRHVRMPTTTLSQGDGGVGVKNGVNFFRKKNWVGSFAIPHAVVNDLDFLETLPEREKRAGLIEAVKVALIRDRAFYERIEELAPALGRLEEVAIQEVIEQSAFHHVDHIAGGGDPFEHGSARPLDFGHWAAHKLEQLSNFGITHGEAVGIGMAIDLLYSVRVGLLESEVADRVLNLISSLGFQLYVPELEKKDALGRLEVLQGLEEFREHLGGELTITLLRSLGEKLEVHDMDEAAVLSALGTLRERYHG
ncbi:MAG: 3-dehydroquinate synthase [Verrucomicrobiales bacterium]|jgi:3-dehydroquinate synthase